jgi:predicted RNase H-like nuclease (RuvC/YqgF family)
MDTEKEQEKNETVDGESETIDGLRRESEVLAEAVKSRDAAIVRLEDVIREKESEIDSLKSERDELKQALDEAGQAVALAVAAYKEMVVQANPGLPAELITGDTIEAVKESVENARAIMDRVRQEMEAAAARTRVPAGAPPRAPLDFTGLSPREKIQQGLK